MRKMSIDNKLKVSEIQRFCMHDGPGVRTTVFFKGCPLRCAWCHNPETQSMHSEMLFYPSKCINCGICENICKSGAISKDNPHRIDRQLCKACSVCANSCPTCALEVSGKDMTIAEILEIVKKDSGFYGELGGITLSGGEPFSQGENIITLLRECKSYGISTVVETSGYADKELLIKAVPYVDLFLWDIKDTNDDRHIRYTGVSNSLCLDNLKAVNEAGANIGLRCILVNGINTDVSHYCAISEIAKEIKHLERIEAIPYHAYGGCKTVFLGGTDNGRVDWIPTQEQIDKFNEIIDETAWSYLNN